MRNLLHAKAEKLDNTAEAAVSAAQAAEAAGCFYSAFACLCLGGSFWRAPPL